MRWTLRRLGVPIGVVVGCAGFGRCGFAPVADLPRTCLEAARRGMNTGRTLIDPDGQGLAPREVWCEQDRRGGGWALALKIDGGGSMFAGAGEAWGATALFGTDNLDPRDPGEAKLAPYVDSPVAEVMLVVDNRNDIALPVRATSLHAALASGFTIPTAVPEAQWRAAFGATSLETGCRRQGLGISGQGATPAVRIGLVANNEASDCRTPASFVGVGGNIPCPDGTMLAAGAVSSTLGDGGARCMPARVLVFVRDDDRTYHPALPSCADHLAAGRDDNGIYLVGNPAVPRRCEMTIDDGGWTNALDLDSLREPCPTGWQQLPDPRLCVHSLVPTNTPTASITVEAPLASYHQVMVSVAGFQIGTTDGFTEVGTLTLDDPYLDGLSITTESPRRHIASYAVGHREQVVRDDPAEHGLLCPCLRGAAPPSYVSPGPVPAAWRCESGSIQPEARDLLRVLDPVFDGAEVPAGCAPEASAEPIRTDLGGATSARLEARLMTDEPDNSDREGLAVYRLELWVR